MRGFTWHLPVFAALGLALISTSVLAAPKATSKSNATGNGNPAMTALHQAHTLLATANHDYDGHRAKAEHHITQAMHEMGGHHQGQGKNKGRGRQRREREQRTGEQGATGPVRRTLQKAVQLLTGMQGQVSNAKAAEHIKEAIAELNTALKIK